MSGEWRWIPNRLALDMALFYDTGKVATAFDATRARRASRSDFGIGMRFHGPLATPLRVELARAARACELVFSGSAAF